MKRKGEEKRVVIGLLGVILILLPCMGHTAIPQTINYQGYLTNAEGVPVNGTVQMVFSIYNVDTGGTALWTEIQNAMLTQGVYNLTLGEVTPMTLTFDIPYHLGIAVGTDPEMTPRIPLTSVGYAFRAKSVDSVGSHTHSGEDIISGTVSEPWIDSAIARTSALTGHTSNTNNPHSTTVTQVGAAPVIHSHNAMDLTSGTLSTDRFSAYSDLTAEGYLDNNADGDLLTRSQADSRFASASTLWGLTGNSGTNPSTNFVGTADNQPLMFRVNNTVALRIYPDAKSPNHRGWKPHERGQCRGFGRYDQRGRVGIGSESDQRPLRHHRGRRWQPGGEHGWRLLQRNFATVGGGEDNKASHAFATVGGGSTNTASGDYATVGGGYNNTASGYQAIIAGGSTNEANASLSTVGGGLSNLASGGYATVGGGYDNTASNSDATVGGGYQNIASGVDSTAGGGIGNQAIGPRSTVGGGWYNIASGNASTVPGGADNLAQGGYSFAAGARAKANNAGCFVWGDASAPSDVTCNIDNRWMARASGGVYFYTNSDLTMGNYIAANTSGWQNISDRNLKDNITDVNAKNILIRLLEIPITAWNFKGENVSIRHIGPMAQDFYAAFGLGIEERSINSIDVDGVALAAIQGLYQLVREKDTRISQLESMLFSIGQRLSELEGRLVGGGR